MRHALPDVDVEDNGESEPEAPVDLVRIAGYWRTALLKKHKIGPERLVILPATAKAGNLNSISVWFVPSGVPLPDPQAIEDLVEPATEDPPQ